MSKQSKITADQLKDQAAEAGKLARKYADEAIEWATPHVEAAKDWAGPKVDKAWRDAVEVAAPKIADAAEKGRAFVDTAHDKLVDDVLPLVVTKMEDAAHAAKEGAEKAADAASDKAGEALLSIEKVAEEQGRKKGGFRRKLGWALVGSAAVGAGVLIWRRTQPVDDPWAEEYWDDAPAAVSPAVANKFEDAAEAAKAKTEEVKEKAAETADKVEEKAEEAKDAVKAKAEEVADKAKDVAEEVKDVAEEAKEKAADTAKKVEKKAAEVKDAVKDAAKDAKKK